MVRSCAFVFSCLVAVLVTGSLTAVGQDPFGSNETKPAGENPLGAEPAKQQQVAVTNLSEAARHAKPMSTNERVRSALDETTRMEFSDTPLLDAVNFLKDYHQIEIQLDNRALEEAGVSSDTPLSRNLGALALNAALRLLLSDHDLAYVVQNDVLLITTRQRASEMHEVRVYDVTKMVDPSVKAEEVGRVLEMVLSDAPQQSSGMPPSGLQNIRIVPLRDLLVIRASQGEHDEISDVLAELSRALPDKD